MSDIPSFEEFKEAKARPEVVSWLEDHENVLNVIRTEYTKPAKPALKTLHRYLQTFYDFPQSAHSLGIALDFYELR